MTHHYVEWRLDVDSVCARFVCRAKDGAFCRLTCAEKCGAETYPCHSYDDDDNEVPHKLVDSGMCNPVEWLSNDDAGSAELYDPDRAREQREIPIRDGAIDVHWNGDHYTWSYAGGPATTHVLTEHGDTVDGPVSRQVSTTATAWRRVDPQPAEAREVAS